MTDEQGKQVAVRDKFEMDMPRDPMLLGKVACQLLNLPDGEAGKMAGVIMTGYELGLPPMTAARSIYIIGGRPVLSSEAQRALVMASPKCEKLVVHNMKIEGGQRQVTVEGTRSNGVHHAVTAKWSQFTHLVNGEKSKHRWNNYPERMLTAAASRWLIRDLFPDIISGFADENEVYDGEIIDITPNPVPPEPPLTPPSPPPTPEPVMQTAEVVRETPQPVKRTRKTKVVNPPPLATPEPEAKPEPEVKKVSSLEEAVKDSQEQAGGGDWEKIMNGE